MSDISGFDWWFRNRDYVLRENLEALELSSRAMASRSAGLSSQLSRLQGSIEHRLNALSAAFDAYVQLGDVREQLAAYSEAATIRREAMAAIGALGDGIPVAAVDDRETGYWVAAATNAVIARVSGSPDEAAEETLGRQEPDAALFLVAATGALGHGAQVADRVAGMLHSRDGLLDDHQLDLWHAVVRGDFGPDVIKSVLADWNDQLRAPSDSDWWDWATRQGSQAGRDALDWIEDQAAGRTDDHDQKPPADTRDEVTDSDQQPPARGLRGLVLELINSGFGDEKQLLSRARELRAKIEHPGISTPSRNDEHLTSNTPVVEAVRNSYTALAPSAARSEIFVAIAPSLAAAVEAEAPRLLSQTPAVVRIRIAGESVDVTPDGPDRRALDKAVVAGSSVNPAANKARLYGFGIAAAACAAVALVLAIAGIAIWLVLLLLIAAVITGVVAVRTLLAARREAERLAQEAAERDRLITDAVERANRSEKMQRQTVLRTADQLDRIQALLVPAAPAAEH